MHSDWGGMQAHGNGRMDIESHCLSYWRQCWCITRHVLLLRYPVSLPAKRVANLSWAHRHSALDCGRQQMLLEPISPHCHILSAPAWSRLAAQQHALMHSLRCQLGLHATGHLQLYDFVTMHIQLQRRFEERKLAMHMYTLPAVLVQCPVERAEPA